MNLNLHDYNVNAKVKTYVNFFFQNNYIPIISKPTRISKTNATIINHINTNNFPETDLKTGILKSDISDYFPVFLISKTTEADKHSAETFVKRRNINSEALQEFKQILSLVDWDPVTKPQDANAVYNRSLGTFSGLGDIAFLEQKIKIKNKTLNII